MVQPVDLPVLLLACELDRHDGSLLHLTGELEYIGLLAHWRDPSLGLERTRWQDSEKLDLVQIHLDTLLFLIFDVNIWAEPSQGRVAQFAMVLLLLVFNELLLALSFHLRGTYDSGMELLNVQVKV